MEETEIPFGYCQCGCGEKTTIAKVTDRRKGIVKGQPVRYLRGDHARWAKRQKWEPIDHPTDATKVLIPLTKGMQAIVDRDDLPLLLGKTWTAKQSAGGHWYALTTRNGKHILMHRLILGMEDMPGSVVVDHVDGNSLNNTRENIRVATNREMQGNRRTGSNNRSGFKGPVFDRSTGQWRAQIREGGRSVDLGGFYTKQEAAMAYDRAAKRVFGEFARLNFPDASEEEARP